MPNYTKVLCELPLLHGYEDTLVGLEFPLPPDP